MDRKGHAGRYHQDQVLLIKPKQSRQSIIIVLYTLPGLLQAYVYNTTAAYAPYFPSKTSPVRIFFFPAYSFSVISSRFP